MTALLIPAVAWLVIYVLISAWQMDGLRDRIEKLERQVDREVPGDR